MPSYQGTVGGRRAASASYRGTTIEQFAFEKLAPNKVVSLLNVLDQNLTPQNGLRRWNPTTKKLEPFKGSDAAGKKILLLIHGTFSNCDKIIEDLNAAPGNAGKDLLEAASSGKRYDFVLTFDHPTVAVSPAMNAFDLASALVPYPKAIDLVAHSRGGLVARWYLEGFTNRIVERRAVLVASTIAGTSLAAPPRVRAAFNHLANVGSVLGGASRLLPHPFILASGTLLRVVSSIIKFGTATPVLDAAVAMIPGFQGQSRVGNNPELLRLQENWVEGGIAYFVVKSDFRPKDPGWNFLQYFSKPMQRVEHWAADLVFEGPNDLIVDGDSMASFSRDFILPESHILDFGENDLVHHTNYFLQTRTLSFIRAKLRF
jgi:pimeloyl-ACP methyl ester carboxylesterase